MLLKEAVSNKVSIDIPETEKGGQLKPKSRREEGRQRNTMLDDQL